MRFDRLSDAVSLDYQVWEISIMISPVFQSIGVGYEALVFGLNLLPHAELRAHVHRGNNASRALFEKAGFKYSADNYMIYSPF